jgi:hypothetical protein
VSATVGAVNLSGASPNDRLNGYISASRITLDPKQVAKTPDGASIVPLRTKLFPDTGFAPLDNTAQRVNAMAGYAPDAVSETSSATFKGGIYGGVCGLIIGFASQGVGIIGDLIAKRPPGGMVVLGLFTGIGAVLGSIVGLLKSTRKSAEDIKTMLFRGQLPTTFAGDTYERRT